MAKAKAKITLSGVGWGLLRGGWAILRFPFYLLFGFPVHPLEKKIERALADIDFADRDIPLLFQSDDMYHTLQHVQKNVRQLIEDNIKKEEKLEKKNADLTAQVTELSAACETLGDQLKAAPEQIIIALKAAGVEITEAQMAAARTALEPKTDTASGPVPARKRRFGFSITGWRKAPEPTQS